MPRKYDEQTKTKAVRLVTGHRDDYSSEYEAIKTVAGRRSQRETPSPRSPARWSSSAR